MQFERFSFSVIAATVETSSFPSRGWKFIASFQADTVISGVERDADWNGIQKTTIDRGHLVENRVYLPRR